MSQKKVDYYKEQKKNRAEIMRKEKRNRRLGITAAIVIAAALLGWFGYLLVQNARSSTDGTTQAMELDVSDMDGYLQEMDGILSGEETEEAAEGESTSEETEETAESTSESASTSSAD